MCVLDANLINKLYKGVMFSKLLNIIKIVVYIVLFVVLYRTEVLDSYEIYDLNYTTLLVILIFLIFNIAVTCVKNYRMTKLLDEYMESNDDISCFNLLGYLAVINHSSFNVLINTMKKSG